MKNVLYLCLFASVTSFSQTPITDDNLQVAIYECLSTNPVDGLCYDSEYGAMPDWDVSAVTNMDYAFFSLWTFNADISGWDVSNVLSMESMFNRAFEFNQDISSWDVSNVINLRSMFEQASSFDQDISTWDVSNTTDLSSMFNFADHFKVDVSS